MPWLEGMQRHQEVSRLQTEISLLEQQIAELDTYTPMPGVRSNATQTDGDDTVWKHEASQVSYPVSPGEKAETKSTEITEETKALDRFVTVRKKIALPLTSTPKLETGAGHNADLNSITPSPNKNNNASDISNTDSKKSVGAKIKPATFDGTGNWLDYKAHFEVCAQLNG